MSYAKSKQNYGNYENNSSAILHIELLSNMYCILFKPLLISFRQKFATSISELTQLESKLEVETNKLQVKITYMERQIEKYTKIHQEV